MVSKGGDVSSISDPVNVKILRWCESVERALHFVQSADNRREIHFEHTPTGLGGQISRRNLALRIALITGARAVFPKETLYPYALCFEPLGVQRCESSATELDLETVSFKDEAVRFDFWKFWSMPSTRDKVYSFLPPDAPFDTKAMQILFDGILFRSQLLSETYRTKALAFQMRLDLPREFVGVHYRRGDKTAETPYVPAEAYRRCIEAACAQRGIKCVLIASDSPSALKDLGLGALGLNVIFDSSELRLNNANHKYLMRNPGFAERETETAINNIYALSQSAYVVGQDNAHFATLAAGLVSRRTCRLDNHHLLDGRMLLQRSGWKQVYAIKETLRTAVKAVFFTRTLRGRKRH
jgi:hypothetical protein